MYSATLFYTWSSTCCFTALLSTVTTFPLFLKHLSSHDSVIHCWYSPWPDFQLTGWRPPGVFWFLHTYNRDYQHNPCFIVYFVAGNSDASHHLKLSCYYWLWSFRVKTHLQFRRQVTWWVIFTPNKFIAFVNCLVNRKSVSTAIKYS